MTANYGKNIQIYLPTGEPRRMRIADITNRIVSSVAILRTDSAVAKQRSELERSGVYFVFCEEENNAKPIVYIAQTEDARKRLDDHNKYKSFWKTAVFCLSKSTKHYTGSNSLPGIVLHARSRRNRKISARHIRYH